MLSSDNSWKPTSGCEEWDYIFFMMLRVKLHLCEIDFFFLLIARHVFFLFSVGFLVLCVTRTITLVMEYKVIKLYQKIGEHLI